MSSGSCKSCSSVSESSSSSISPAEPCIICNPGTTPRTITVDLVDGWRGGDGLKPPDEYTGTYELTQATGGSAYAGNPCVYEYDGIYYEPGDRRGVLLNVWLCYRGQLQIRFEMNYEGNVRSSLIGSPAECPENCRTDIIGKFITKTEDMPDPLGAWTYSMTITGTS